jgi:hypothetical protein
VIIEELTNRVRAEGAGFEPANDLRRLRFSRPVHSTALPPLRNGEGYPWCFGTRRAFGRRLTAGDPEGMRAITGARAQGARYSRGGGLGTGVRGVAGMTMMGEREKWPQRPEPSGETIGG